MPVCLSVTTILSLPPNILYWLSKLDSKGITISLFILKSTDKLSSWSIVLISPGTRYVSLL